MFERARRSSRHQGPNEVFPSELLSFGFYASLACQKPCGTGVGMLHSRALER